MSTRFLEAAETRQVGVQCQAPGVRHPPSMEGWGAAPHQLRTGVESSGHLVAGQAPWRPLLTPLGHGRLES